MYPHLLLALEWNRIDLAKDYILVEKNEAKLEQFDDLMFIAIRDNRFEFVELFLENGFSLQSFLTYRVLLKLYNEVDRLWLSILIRNLDSNHNSLLSLIFEQMSA